jgi:hypothetical protein
VLHDGRHIGRRVVRLEVAAEVGRLREGRRVAAAADS